MVVDVQQPLEVCLDVVYGQDFDLLFDVEAGDALHHHLRDYPHGTYAADRRFEKVIRWEALVFFTFAVYQGDSLSAAARFASMGNSALLQVRPWRQPFWRSTLKVLERIPAML